VAAGIWHHRMRLHSERQNGFEMPLPLFYRQSTASDLGALAKRSGVKCLVLTHLIPAIDAERHGPWKIPGGPVTQADYR
jgi:ribonuclease Z